MVKPEIPEHVTRFQGVEKHSAGYQLMAKLGWKEGQGLGANKQGITTHIRVKKKQDQLGVGVTEADKRARDWTLGMVQYDNVLAKLSEVTSQHASRGGDSSSEDSFASGGEEPATGKTKKRKGKAPAGKAAKRKCAPVAVKQQQQAPARPAAASSSGSDPDGDSSEDEQPAPKRQRAARHVGRFTRREAGKKVKNYSSKDLAAILGGQDAAKNSSGGESDDGSAERPATPPMEQPEPLAPPHAATESSGDDENGDVVATHSEPQEGFWWSGYFTRAGRLGGMRTRKEPPADPSTDPVKPQVNVHGFSEKDQENLYTLTQGGASQGRQGLGRSSEPKKLTGSGSGRIDK
ncbi:hypothetical protein WJX72_004183 [[Myrmecia] bisecta]|uniref:G-patch domain-containing protein n=1 Tax=[Myrmecia] bisecta TaxID=41462 RepID=A0AAW1PXC6_9CHLO